MSRSSESKDHEEPLVGRVKEGFFTANAAGMDVEEERLRMAAETLLTPALRW